MKQAAKEAFENNIHHHDTMKTIANANSSNRQCSVREAVYQILPKLNLRKISPVKYFASTNLSVERVQVLLPEKELSQLSKDSPAIFKRSNIDC